VPLPNNKLGVSVTELIDGNMALVLREGSRRAVDLERVLMRDFKQHQAASAIAEKTRHSNPLVNLKLVQIRTSANINIAPTVALVGRAHTDVPNVFGQVCLQETERHAQRERERERERDASH
jgi:hypothetical protein